MVKIHVVDCSRFRSQKEHELSYNSFVDADRFSNVGMTAKTNLQYLLDVNNITEDQTNSINEMLNKDYMKVHEDMFESIGINSIFHGTKYGFRFSLTTKSIFEIGEVTTQEIISKKKKLFPWKKVQTITNKVITLEELCNDPHFDNFDSSIKTIKKEKLLPNRFHDSKTKHVGLSISINDAPLLPHRWINDNKFFETLIEEGKMFEKVIQEIYQLYGYDSNPDLNLFFSHSSIHSIKSFNISEVNDRKLITLVEFDLKKEMEKISSQIPGIDELTHKIGEGGNRECYAGLMKGKEIVISIMKEDRIRKDAWQNEIDAFWELNHEAIIGYVHNPGTLSDGRPYIIMKQFAKGENLEDYVLKHGPLTTKQFKTVFYGDEKESIPGVISALIYTHKKGIYHQDLTLKNILIETDEKDKIVRAKIGDWESARFLGKEQEQEVHESLGSPAYVLNSLSDEEKDKFSLGVCMYVAFTGFNPLLGVPFQKAKTGNSAENRSKLVTKMQETYEQLKTDLDMQKQMGNRLGKSLWVGSYRHILGLINQNEGFCHLPTDSSGLDISDPDHERRVKEYFAANELPA
jgi:serine/threonine protein kinase